MKMKGVVFPGNKKVELKEFEVPEPGPGEALVKVKASALCRSDMSLYYGKPVVGGEVAKSGRIIPGHEPAGEVVKIGEGVNNVKVGDRVAIYLAVTCGNCVYCRSGHKVLCPDFKCIGFDLHGGDAEYILIPSENCLKIPDEMSFEVAAVSTDAFGTLYNAQRKLNVSGSDTVAIFGVGPMGGAGILVAKGLGATVVAIDLVDARLNWAKELGADFTINAGKTNPVSEILKITKGKGADVAIDCSGSKAGESSALNCVRPFGRVAFIGENQELTIDPSNQFIRKEITLIGSWYFPIWLYEEIIDFIMQKKVPIEKLITDTFSLEEAETAFLKFDKRETIGKVVFVID